MKIAFSDHLCEAKNHGAPLVLLGRGDSSDPKVGPLGGGVIFWGDFPLKLAFTPSKKQQQKATKLGKGSWEMNTLGELQIA